MPDEQQGIPPILAIFVIGIVVVVYEVVTMDKSPPKKLKYGKEAWHSK